MLKLRVRKNREIVPLKSLPGWMAGWVWAPHLLLQLQNWSRIPGHAKTLPILLQISKMGAEVLVFQVGEKTLRDREALCIVVDIFNALYF